MRTDLRDDEAVEVQMAPLIDCVFLLLIFFLVATTLKKIDEELPLVLPDSKAAIEVQQPDDYCVIAIDMEGGFYFDGTPVQISVLQEQVRARHRANPAVKVRVDAHREIPFNRVMEVLDLLRFEKIAAIGINTQRGDPYNKLNNETK